jgi:hypothetical protein
VHVVDNVNFAGLKLPLVRLQFSVNAFGAARRQEVVADVALDYEAAEALIRGLTEIMRKVREAQAVAVAASEPRGSVN